jgi:hypothetical protein
MPQRGCPNPPQASRSLQVPLPQARKGQARAGSRKGIMPQPAPLVGNYVESNRMPYRKLTTFEVPVEPRTRIAEELTEKDPTRRRFRGRRTRPFGARGGPLAGRGCALRIRRGPLGLRDPSARCAGLSVRRAGAPAGRPSPLTGCPGVSALGPGMPRPWSVRARSRSRDARSRSGHARGTRNLLRWRRAQARGGGDRALAARFDGQSASPPYGPANRVTRHVTSGVNATDAAPKSRESKASMA